MCHSRRDAKPQVHDAMQLMQSDPEAAKKRSVPIRYIDDSQHANWLCIYYICRFMGDPDVDAFLKEFGRVMSAHFEKLGAQRSASVSAPTKAHVEEVGVLQAARRSQQPVDAEDARVREVLEDQELRELLIDPHMQRVLQVPAPCLLIGLVGTAK